MPQRTPRTSRADADRPRLPRRADYGPWIRRAVVFVSCALALNALIGERGLAETVRARRHLRQMQAEVARLAAENAALLRKADLLRTDRQTIEHVAREELGLIRKGEVLVVLTNVAPR